MARRSEIEQKIADLQAQLEDADTDDEVWIKDDSGREFKVTGKRATTILGRFADLFDDGKGDDGDDQGDGDGDDQGAGKGAKGGRGKQDTKPAGGGYFGRRG